MMIEKPAISGHAMTAAPVIAGIAMCLILFASSAHSETIYKYVGPDGSVTYSDTPPAEIEEYDEMALPDYPAADPDAHRKTLEQMATTSSRLQKERLKREQARQQEKQSTPQVIVYQPQEEAHDYRRPYWYYRDRYHNRHDGPRPPYRLDRDQPQSSKERLKERLTSPINIPSFGQDD